MTRPPNIAGHLVVIGAEGFLGWHVRVLAHAMGLPEPIVVRRDGRS